jgi:hypothetical protein
MNVGYSYGDGVSNTLAAASDVYAFLQIFYKEFSQYANLDFHIAGESYAGHYIPAIAAEINNNNKGISSWILSRPELKTTLDGFTDINDEEIESILPAAEFALAKVHMHLVHSGFCYTARGGLCYTEGDIIDFHTDDGKEVEGLPSEGVEITYFDLEGSRYLLYTPSEPLHYVVVKGENGMFEMADDDLLDDPAVIDAIDEETEFNALVEEEAALIEAMMKGHDDDDDEN